MSTPPPAAAANPHATWRASTEIVDMARSIEKAVFSKPPAGAGGTNGNAAAAVQPESDVPAWW